jgi:cobalt-zinc-cadmium efflux system outer membrane protein
MVVSRRSTLLLFASLVLAGGCTWPVRQETNRTLCDMANQPYDRAPDITPENVKAFAEGHTGSPKAPSATRDQEKTNPLADDIETDVQTTAWMESRPSSGDDEPVSGPGSREGRKRGLDLNIPPRVPGSEAPRVELPRDATLGAEIERIYPGLPPLPVEPKVLPGPEGKAYTLSDFQRLAALHSPTLRQAISDVQAARGNLVQARTYPNPTVGYLVDPTNNNSTAGVTGFFWDQPLRTGGKQKLGVATAQRALDNAQLALRRARSDLSTAVRSAYFSLVVDQETLAVLRAVAGFTDDIYRLQRGLVAGIQAAPYEPAALQAQAFATRLAYKQAIATYIYDWKQLVATLGMEQLPLSRVSGQVDRLIPYYEYDKVLAHVLRNHTDILTARNQVPIARYNLKLAQVTPLIPDLDVRAALEKDHTLAPYGTYKTLAIGFPLPVWDQNRGNIMSAQAALIRAEEESHRVQVSLTYNLGQAYTNYQNNLYALESYRRDILPNLVRYYRGVYARRQIDPASAFGDLVFAQQNLSSYVTSYLTVLGTLWSSVVALADFLQTDDLFQLATPRELPEVPDFEQLRDWPCRHPALAAQCVNLGAGQGPGGVVHGKGRAAPAPAPNGTAPLAPQGDELEIPPDNQSSSGRPALGEQATAPQRVSASNQGYLRQRPNGARPQRAQQPAELPDRWAAPQDDPRRDGAAQHEGRDGSDDVGGVNTRRQT